MPPPTETQLQQIFKTLNERGKQRSLISLASTSARQDTQRPRQELYRALGITHPSDQAHAEEFYSIRRSNACAAYNRYHNIFAFDRTAVRIPNDLRAWLRTRGEGAAGVGDVEELGEADSGYLNANVVVDGKGGWWVACQAPLPTTFHPFLLAILTRSATFKHAHLYGHNSSSGEAQQWVMQDPPKTAIIVQLTSLFEGTTVKAHQYLPTQVGGSVTYDPPEETAHSQPAITLTLDRTTTIPETSSTLSTLTLSAAPSWAPPIPSMTVHHYAFEGWPDWGVPQGTDVDRLEALIAEVAKKKGEAEGGCEVWVHCSAGVGRTGTYIAISSILTPPHGPVRPPFQSPLGPLPRGLRRDPVASLVDLLREQRAVMCQSDSQVGLVYELWTRRVEGARE